MAFVAILVLAAALVILFGRWRRAGTVRGRDTDRRRGDGSMILPIDVPVSGDASSPGNADFNPGGGDFGGAGSSGDWGDSDSSDGGGGD